MDTLITLQYIMILFLIPASDCGREGSRPLCFLFQIHRPLVKRKIIFKLYLEKGMEMWVLYI